MAPATPSGAVFGPSFPAAEGPLQAGSALGWSRLRVLAAAAVVAVTGCAGAPPPAEETSVAVVPPAVSAPAAIASAAPPSAPAPPPSTAAVSAPAPAPAPSAAPPIDRHTCQPHPPAVSFEVTNDDIVVPLDAQGCPLGESHFKANGFSYQASVDFMTDLQRRLEAGDRPGLADLTKFPLRVNVARTVIVKDRATFLRIFDQIYPPAVVSAILAADPRDVFCNSQGVALGRGIVWAYTSGKGHYGLITVNGN